MCIAGWRQVECLPRGHAVAAARTRSPQSAGCVFMKQSRLASAAAAGYYYLEELAVDEPKHVDQEVLGLRRGGEMFEHARPAR